MNALMILSLIFSIAFTLCYGYQFVFAFIPFFFRGRKYKNTHLHKFAVIISARNERTVISNLIESIKNQSYPQELVEVFVIADNCTDDTADIAAKAGATVWERFDEVKKGKGYALDFAFEKMLSDKEKYDFDGFFIFDADNILEENYIEEVNKMFTPENKIITGYRNSKNYGRNWITAGYSLWFIRESQFLNRSRHILNTSCAVSGTGFMFAREIIERIGGWKYFLLTEDIEFTVDNILHDVKIAYCENAMLYDEQPYKFGQSWNQRMRWTKGFIQILKRYGFRLIKSIFKFRSFANFDISMVTLPGVILSVGSIVGYAAAGIAIAVSGQNPMLLVMAVLGALAYTYIVFFAMGLLTVCAEWKKIHTSAFKKIIYLFTFPFFMLTYIPITLVAIFKKVEWTPIHHSESKTLADVKMETE